MIDKDNNEHWYALKVFYNRVSDIEQHLIREGVKSYIPMRSVRTVVNNRTVSRRVPAISSLMFVCGREQYIIELRERLKATSPFMIYSDREAHSPVAIADMEMKIFMLATSQDHSDVEYLTEDAVDFRSGDKVRVTGGPFLGAEGYIKRIKGNRRLILSIEGVVAVATTYIPSCFLEKTRE